MSFRYLAGLFLLVALSLTACSQDGIYSGKLILGGELVVPVDVVETSHILLMDGSLTLSEGAVIRGNIYQVLGVFNLDGTVDGDVSQFGGEMILGPQARILGNLQVGGGNQRGLTDQLVVGQVLRSQVRVPLSPEWFAEEFSRQVYWALGETLILTILAFILGMAFPVALERVKLAISGHALVSAAMGLLVGIVGLSLLIQMIFTILLIPVSLLGLILFGIAIGVGWIGFGLLVGQWLVRQLGVNWSHAVIAGVGTLVFMTLLNAIGLLPGVGDLITIGTAIVGLGAVFLTRFGARPFVPVSIEQ